MSGQDGKKSGRQILLKPIENSGEQMCVVLQVEVQVECSIGLLPLRSRPE